MPATDLIQRLREHREASPQQFRRQAVTAVFLVLGACVLGYTLRIPTGSNSFYVATLVLAAVWIVGAFASGPIRLGEISGPHGPRRPWVQGVAVGLLLGVVFVVGGFVVHFIPPIDDLVASVLAHADRGNAFLVLFVTLLNGLAEELFFRGAVFSAITSRPWLWSTVVYFVATLATGNPMLAFAAILLGFVAAQQRRVSGGVLAPVLTHVTWSTVMLYALPAIF